jgi:hypothetical protein
VKRYIDNNEREKAVFVGKRIMAEKVKDQLQQKKEHMLVCFIIFLSVIASSI